jgi:ABC-type uncharacterized transport system permease subunit
VVGAAACFVAIFLWFRQLWQTVAANDRSFLLALVPAIAVYALTDNVLIYATGLALFAYLGVLLTRPARGSKGEPSGRRRRSSSRSGKRSRSRHDEPARGTVDA